MPFTDARGRVRLVTNAKGLLLVAMSADAFLLGDLTLAQPSTPLELLLRPCPTIEGSVVDEDGAPVAGAMLQMAGSGASLFSSLVMEANSTLQRQATGADGRFKLCYVPLEGTIFGVAAQAQNEGQWVSTGNRVAFHVAQEGTAGAKVVLPFRQKAAAGGGAGTR